jgi:hypothetical protein
LSAIFDYDTSSGGSTSGSDHLNLIDHVQALLRVVDKKIAMETRWFKQCQSLTITSTNSSTAWGRKAFQLGFDALPLSSQEKKLTYNLAKHSVLAICGFRSMEQATQHLERGLDNPSTTEYKMSQGPTT